MDFSIIDELYQIYLNDDLFEAAEKFDIYYKRFQTFGNHDFIQTIEQFVKEQTPTVSNSFISTVDTDNKIDHIARMTTAAFETLLPPVDYSVTDFMYDGCDEEEIKELDIEKEMLRPHDLFNMNLTFVEGAIKKYSSFDLPLFEKVKNIIEYVKKNNLLDSTYKDGSWYQINFEELIANLYDKAKDKSVFDVEFEGVETKYYTLFDRIKENCSHIADLEFDKYRPQINSSKQIRAEFGKLIFCKNILLYFNTGIIPDKYGYINCSVGDVETYAISDKFNNLYSRNYDEASFRSLQGNFIFKPEIWSTNYTIAGAKKIVDGNRMIFGILLYGTHRYDLSERKIPYLLHINIEDIKNPQSNYEIQLNVLPQGRLTQRVQLMRLDNWDSEQPHRNIAKKLSTTTHIHLYNEFDVLRGKVNGAFDIAYNLDSQSTDFQTALNIFLNILDLEDDVLKDKILSSIIKSIHKGQTSVQTERKVSEVEK